ncbi:hypothetical protein G6F22_015402 [Rhizopus arrhizus]|nr:hypothetical protein G6F22_015402 [Rhizopus arrhizus]
MSAPRCVENGLNVCRGLRPLDRASGYGEVDQAHVADFEIDLVLARHQVGLLLCRVQADANGRHVVHGVDYRLAVVHGRLQRVFVVLQNLDGEPGFLFEADVLVGQHSRKRFAGAVDVLSDDCEVVQGHSFATTTVLPQPSQAVRVDWACSSRCWRSP